MSSIREVIYELNGEIGIEKTKAQEDNPYWTAEYSEGFIDGLKRAVEIVKNFEVEDE